MSPARPSPSSLAGADSLHSPQLGVLGGHHQPRPGPRHQVQHAVLGRARLLVAALVHGEGLGHHERAVHAGVQRAQLLQLLDAAGGGEEAHLAQVSAELHVTHRCSHSDWPIRPGWWPVAGVRWRQELDTGYTAARHRLCPHTTHCQP